MYLIDVCFTPRKGVTTSEFVQKFFNSEPVAGEGGAGEVFRPKFPVLFKEHPLQRGENGVLAYKVTFCLCSVSLPEYAVDDFCRALKLFFRHEGAHLCAVGTKCTIETTGVADKQEIKVQAAEAHG